MARGMRRAPVRRRRRFPVLALLAGVGTALPVTAAEVCATPTELAALNGRAMQTTLMVAALSCAHRPLYNAFVTRHHAVLSAQGRAVRAFFLRAYGATGESELDAFVTRLANEASRRSSNGHAEFCAAAAAMFARTAESLPGDGGSADPALPGVEAYGACRVPAQQAAALRQVVVD